MTDFAQSKKLKNALLWLDLETTGLEPASGVVLEACAILTDMDLTELKRIHVIARHDRDNIIGMMDDYVLKMHLNNGLLEEVWNATEGVLRMDERLAAVCNHWDLADDCNVYLAGSSIHFDRRWAREHLRRLDKRLHYRMVDVSLYGTSFPGLLKKPKSGGHRAEADIENSINLHEQMLRVLGRPVRGEPTREFIGEYKGHPVTAPVPPQDRVMCEDQES